MNELRTALKSIFGQPGVIADYGDSWEKGNRLVGVLNDAVVAAPDAVRGATERVAEFQTIGLELQQGIGRERAGTWAATAGDDESALDEIYTWANTNC